MAKRLRRDRISKKLTHYIRVKENPALYPNDPNLGRAELALINEENIADIKGISRFFGDLNEFEVYPPLLAHVRSNYVPMVDTVFSKLNINSKTSAVTQARLITNAQEIDSTDMGPDKFEEFDRFLYQTKQRIHTYLFRKDNNHQLRTPIQKAFKPESLDRLYGEVAKAAGIKREYINDELTLGYLLSLSKVANSIISAAFLEQKQDKSEYSYAISYFNRKVDEPLFALKDLRKSLIKSVEQANLSIQGAKEVDDVNTVWGMLRKVNDTLSQYNGFPPAIQKLDTRSACKVFQQQVHETKLKLEREENIVFRLARFVTDGAKRLWHGMTGMPVQLSAIATLGDLEQKAITFIRTSKTHASSYGLVANETKPIEEEAGAESQVSTSDRLALILNINLDEISLDDALCNFQPKSLVQAYSTCENKQEFIELLEQFSQTAKYETVKTVCSAAVQMLKNLQSLALDAEPRMEQPISVAKVDVEHDFTNDTAAEGLSDKTPKMGISSN